MAKHILKLATLFTLLLATIKCNLWDNIFSHLNGPLLIIPDEFTLELTQDSEPRMSILFSTELNSIKLSLLDKARVHKITNQSSILNVIANFTNSTISFDYEDNCTYLNVTPLRMFNSTFLTASYDILTYYNETEDFYEYYFSNPLEPKEERNSLVFLDTSSDNKTEEDTLKEVMNELNFSSSIKFSVNKTTLDLESVMITYSDIDYATYKANVTKHEKSNFTDFERQHDCSEMNITESNQTNISSYILNNLQ